MGLIKWQYRLLFYAFLIFSTISMSFAAGGVDVPFNPTDRFTLNTHFTTKFSDDRNLL